MVCDDSGCPLSLRFGEVWGRRTPQNGSRVRNVCLGKLCLGECEGMIMKINIRSSIDQSLSMENFLRISNEHWARVLLDNPDLSDNLVVAIAEVCNFFRQTNDFFSNEMTPNLKADMDMFGEQSQEDRQITIVNESDISTQEGEETNQN